MPKMAKSIRNEKLWENGDVYQVSVSYTQTRRGIYKIRAGSPEEASRRVKLGIELGEDGPENIEGIGTVLGTNVEVTGVRPTTDDMRYTFEDLDLPGKN